MWSLLRGPHELAYATNVRLQAQFVQTPQYEIGKAEPYELVDGVFSGQMSASWLVVPIERLSNLGFIDPDNIDTIGEQLQRKLGLYDGVNFIGEDKLSKKPLFRVNGAKMTSLGMTVSRTAIVFRDAQFAVQNIPGLHSGFFT